jgi:hypothetical protein
MSLAVRPEAIKGQFEYSEKEFQRQDVDPKLYDTICRCPSQVSFSRLGMK